MAYGDTYIDLPYYRDEYQGKYADDPDWARVARRASDMISGLTGGKIGALGDLPAQDQELVKLATASQTEWLLENGDVYGYASSGGSSVKIGKFSHTGGSSSSSGSRGGKFSPLCVQYLFEAGLLYRGLQATRRYC